MGSIQTDSGLSSALSTSGNPHHIRGVIGSERGRSGTGSGRGRSSMTGTCNQMIHKQFDAVSRRVIVSDGSRMCTNNVEKKVKGCHISEKNQRRHFPQIAKQRKKQVVREK